jgi:hypothetical protein
VVGVGDWTARLGEWRLPIILGIVLAAVSAVPYLNAFATHPQGTVFMGFLYLGDDANTYLAKMREGYDGGWAWTNRYTTESSPPAYLFLFWILLGHAAVLLHLPLLATFHLARVAGSIFLMLAAWAFVSHFIENPTARRFAIVLIAIGLGCGYVVQALGHPVVFGRRSDTLDWRMPELSAFYSILALPHFTWSAAFQALGVVLTLRAADRGSLRTGVAAGAMWLGQATIHPQMPILLGGAVAAALLARPARPRGMAAAALSFLIPAPYILYCYLAFRGNPEVARWTFHSQNAIPPDVFSLFFALAPQLLLAALAVPLIVRRRSRNDLFLAAWLLLLASILWLPNPAGDLRRRFFDGIYLLLGVMAAMGMYGFLVPRLRSDRARRMVPFGYVSFTTIGSSFLILAAIFFISGPGWNQYVLSRCQYDALLWLDSQPQGTVLSSVHMGQYIPAYSSDTVYVGHYDETFDYFEKAPQAKRLLTGKDDLPAFIQAQHVRYVVWTDEYGGDPPTDLGEPVFSEPGVRIYRIY